MTENAFISEVSIRFLDDDPTRPLVVVFELDYGGMRQQTRIQIDRLPEFMRMLGVVNFARIKRAPVRVESRDEIPIAILHYTHPQKFVI